MSEQKPVKYNHYRAVFKSDHFGVADLEDLLAGGHNGIVTITHCTQHMAGDNPIKVAGKSGKFNIAHFSDPDIKPWVLNSGNTTLVKRLSGAINENINIWPEVTVQLYIDPTAKFGTEVTGGVRILDKKITKEKKWLTPENTKAWGHAKTSVSNTGSFEDVLNRMNISDEHKTLMLAEIKVAKDA